MREIAKRLEVLYDLKRFDELLLLSVPACVSNDEDTIEAYRYTILALMHLDRLKEARVYCDTALENFPTEVHFLDIM